MAVSSTQRSRELLNATYELEELVSSHGAHEVYRGRDLRDGSAVWVKRPRPELARTPHELARFAARARVLEQLRHRCLPRVCVDADDADLVFLVQEVVDGRPLSDLIGAFPQGIPLPLLAAVVVPLVEALALAHAAGLSHGALDPANVRLLGPLHEPSAKLVGLELGRFVQDQAYRAPELAVTKAREPAADVFACGVLLYHMLSGVLPFQAGTRSAVPLDELAPHVSADFVRLTAACLHDDPTRRPADAGKLLSSLLACRGLPPRRRAAQLEATRPDTNVDSERAAPRVSGRSPRAQPADVAPRTAAVSQRAPAGSDAAPAPLASERVKRAPDRAAISAQQAADLLSAKRDASSRPAPRVSGPAPARALQPAAANANVRPRASQPSAAALAANQTAKPHASQLAAASPSQRAVAGPGVEPRQSQPAAGPSGKPRVSQPAAAQSVRPRPSQPGAEPSVRPRGSQPAAAGPIAERASQLAAAEARVQQRASQPAAAGAAVEAQQSTGAEPGVVPRSSRPSTKPALELTRAQLDALALLRHKYDEEEERDRWVAVLFALLLLLLFTAGAPFFLGTGLATAHATFGPKLRLAATAFSIATVVGALHPLVAQAGRYWLVQRLRGAVMQADALGFVVVTAGLYSSSPLVVQAGDFTQRWLPWGVGLGLLLLVLEYLLRGARNLAHDLRYATLVLALALLGSFGSYRAVMRALEHEQQRSARLLAKNKQPAAESGVGEGEQPAGARGLAAERSGLGDNEARDLAPAQDIETTRRRDSAAVERLQQRLSTPDTNSQGN